jgi:hypothetical protein
MNSEPSLVMWTVYDHPRDFPDAFVARRFDIAPGAAVCTDHVMTSGDIEDLRQRLVDEASCTDCIARSPDDDQTIVEVWMAIVPGVG